MRHRLLVLVAALTIVTPLVLIGAAKEWTPPRTPWGDPDLQGAYSNDDETGIPLERPAEFAGRTLADITPAGGRISSTTESPAMSSPAASGRPRTSFSIHSSAATAARGSWSIRRTAECRR